MDSVSEISLRCSIVHFCSKSTDICPTHSARGYAGAMSFRNVILLDHPVIQTKLAELRDYSADHREFRALLDEIAGLMVYEVTRDWPTKTRPVQTPLERTTGECAGQAGDAGSDSPAGLGMASGVLRLLPTARMGHLGVYRDEKTLEPVSYYQKLPPDIASTEVLLIDPMLATGGSGSGRGDISESRGGDQHEICLPRRGAGRD